MAPARWRGWIAAAVVAIAGCGRNDAVSNPSGGDSGDAGAGGFPASCGVAFSYPSMPVASPGAVLTVSAAISGASGHLTYAWTAMFAGAPAGLTPAGDGSSVQLSIPAPGIYSVSLVVEGSTPVCSPAGTLINVGALGAVRDTIRLRIVPPRSSGVPVQELVRGIAGGADADLGAIPVDSGPAAEVEVTGPAGGVPAYLKFAPAQAPDAVIEGFSDAQGRASVHLIAAQYAVLVVPSVDGAVARRFASWTPGAPLALDAGQAVTGSVRDPGGAPLAGASVQLRIDGAPSTLGVTAADGQFALRAVTGSAVAVDVVPPDGSGLPRLSAQGISLAAPLQIQYAPGIARVDLGGAVVQRNGAPSPGARVTAVGTLAVAGTITTGAQVTASGEIRITATAGASGALPAMRVPTAAQSLVVEVAAGDLAVVALDPSKRVIDAPAMPLVTTAAVDGQGHGVAGAMLDLVPTGALALAAAPALRVMASPDGAITQHLPAGGHYDLRFQDPAGRRAPLVVPDRVVNAAPVIASSYALPAAIRISGVLRVDSQAALPGAAVELMCMSCTGVDRDRPLAEVAADDAGRFTLAVPDPGTR